MTSIRLSTVAVRKTPNETRKFDLSFASLLATDETISSVSSTDVSPSGLTVDSAAATGQVVQFTLSGGVAGTVYEVSVTVVSSNGQTLEGSVRASVRS